MSLTVKEETFVQGLFKGLSQRQAYKSAYKCKNWKDTTIDNKACLLAKKNEIMKRLHELQQKQAEKSSWTVERLISEFDKVRSKCMQEEEVMIYDKCSKGYVGTGEYVFKEHGAIKAMENIGKLLGYYKEKIEHSGEIKMPTITITK